MEKPLLELHKSNLLINTDQLFECIHRYFNNLLSSKVLCHCSTPYAASLSYSSQDSGGANLEH